MNDLYSICSTCSKVSFSQARLVSMDPSLASMALLQWERDDEGDVVAAASDVYFLHLHQGSLAQANSAQGLACVPRCGKQAKRNTHS